MLEAYIEGNTTDYYEARIDSVLNADKRFTFGWNGKLNSYANTKNRRTRRCRVRVKQVKTPQFTVRVRSKSYYLNTETVYEEFPSMRAALARLRELRPGEAIYPTGRKALLPV